MHPNTAPRIQRALSERPGATAARWLRRARCEFAFAHAFATLLPAEQTAGWTDTIARAQALIDGFDPEGGIWGLSAAVREAEAIRTPIGTAAKGYAIHCVGHGHIDMNWMWSWPETVATTHDTFASVLSLMEQYPDLTYSQSQASVYALVEKYFPDMFACIQERVREGRWEVTAAHWVEGDKNLASGESLCRHVLYARRYFAEKFGLSPGDVPVDWEPDTFGHANTIPTILAQAGVRFYYSCRTGGGFEHLRVGPERPRLFYWQGPDGSRILVNRESTWYNSYVNIGEDIAAPAVEFWRETGLRDWLNIYGVGNHGGGPTRDEIDYYIEMRDWPIYPNVVFSTAKGWYETVEKELATSNSANGGKGIPVLDQELNFEFTGCYTSESLIKQANRFGENYLEDAETLAALASRVYGKTYPASPLRDAWLGVLFNQFHDILPGSGVRQTREHAMGLFQETGAITGAIKRTVGLALTAGIDTLALLPDTPEARDERALFDAGAANAPFVAGAGIHAMETGYSIAAGGGKRFRPFVVYNPCSWTRSEPVTITLYDTLLDPSRIVARDETGAQHPIMSLGRGTDWGHNKLTIVFLARDIPALGYRTFVFCEGVADAPTPRVKAGGGDTFETPFQKFQYNRFQSGFTHFHDKRTAGEAPDSGDASRVPAGSWTFVTEQPRGMTAWALGNETDAPTALKSTAYQVQGASSNEGTNAVDGSTILFRILQTLEVPGTKSSVHLTTLIHGLEPRIDVTAEIDWREIGDDHGIPGLIVNAGSIDGGESCTVRYETPFGSVVRTLKDNEEVPTLRYAHVSSAQSPGFTLLQDCKYGHSFASDSGLRLRMIRSSTSPDHAPEVNKQTVRYSLVFHDKEPDAATLTRLGAAWNHPLIVFPANLQSGDGATPAVRSFAQVAGEGIVLTALKQPEDGAGLILRLVEYNGADSEAVVTLDAALAQGLTQATLVDLMEQPVWTSASTEPTWDGTVLRVPIRAHSFVTVLLQ